MMFLFTHTVKNGWGKPHHKNAAEQKGGTTLLQNLLKSKSEFR